MKSKRNMAGLVSTLAIAVTLTGCGRQPDAPAPGPAEVGIVTIQPQKLAVTTELPGRTSAYQIAEVRPQVGGILQQRLFREGADVKAGAPLYQIDPATFQAAYNSARGSLASAEASALQARLKAGRYQELVAIKAVSQQEYDDAVATQQQSAAQVAVARAAVDNARINLGFTRVTSPISGRIGKSSVTPGALLTANQVVTLTTVQQLDPIYVDVTQSSTELLRLRRAVEAGQVRREGGRIQVSLRLEDGSRYGQTGTLEFSDVTVDPETSTVTLRAVFPNPRQELLPGMYVRAELAEGVDEQAILAPQQGVSRNSKGEATALVVGAGNKVEPRILQVSRTVGDQWLVSGGLQAGDRLIVDGLQKAKPGSEVKPVSLHAAPANAPATTPTSPQARPVVAATTTHASAAAKP